MTVSITQYATDTSLDAEDVLHLGMSKLAKCKAKDDTRWEYYKGEHEKPFTPYGVNEEYQQLVADSPLPLIRLGVRTPVQRLKASGVRLNGKDEGDREAWRIWKRNDLRSRQRTVYTHAFAFGRGIVSVWPNADDPKTPHIRPEDPRQVHVEMDPEDPYTPLWAVKRVTRVNKNANGEFYTSHEAYVYDDDVVTHFRSRGIGTGWEYVEAIPNPMGRVPFVIFAAEMDANGECYSMIDPLIPMQRAIDAMRFDLLLAAQFAAYRQRIISGYDPVLRDEDGDPVFRKNEDGSLVLDSDGQPIPVVTSPGRVGVERFLVFPGDATNVFDLPESDLTNYVGALEMLVATFASTAQVPPQYLIGDFKNVSGDLMVATEATLRSLVADCQTSFDEGWESVFEMVYIARNETPPEEVDVVWSDAEPKSLQQIASAASQMIPNGAPLQMFLEMMPGATPETVRRWMGQSETALNRVLAGDFASTQYGPKPPDDEESDIADVSDTG